MSSIKGWKIIAQLLVAAACLWPALPVHAEEKMTPAQREYLRYCGACHGPDGKGTGGIAGLLTVKPSDLTGLAKKHSGEFPTMEVIEYITGTRRVAAHGDSEMPIWGERFREDTAMSPTQNAEIRGKIQLITDYVRTLQAK